MVEPTSSRSLPAGLFDDPTQRWAGQMCEKDGQRPPWLSDERLKLATSTKFPGPDHQKPHYDAVKAGTASPIDACVDLNQANKSENATKGLGSSIMPQCKAFGTTTDILHKTDEAYRLWFSFYQDGSQRLYFQLHPDDVAWLGPLYMKDYALADQYCSFDLSGKNTKYDSIMVNGGVATQFAQQLTPDRIPLGRLFIGSRNTNDGLKFINVYDHLGSGLDAPLHLSAADLTSKTDGKETWRNVSDTPLSREEALLWLGYLKQAGVEEPHKILRPVALEGDALANQPYALKADASADPARGHRYWQINLAKLNPRNVDALRASMEGVKNQVANLFDPGDRLNTREHVLARTSHFIGVINAFRKDVAGAVEATVQDPARLGDTIQDAALKTEYERVLANIKTEVPAIVAVPDGVSMVVGGDISGYVIAYVKARLGGKFELKRFGADTGSLHSTSGIAFPHMTPASVPEFDYALEIPDSLETDDKAVFDKMKALVLERKGYELTLTRIRLVKTALAEVAVKLSDTITMGDGREMSNPHKLKIIELISRGSGGELDREFNEVTQKASIVQGRIDQLHLTYRGEHMQKEFQAINQKTMDDQKTSTMLFTGSAIAGTVLGAVGLGVQVWLSGKQMAEQIRMHQEGLKAMNEANTALQKEVKPEAKNLIQPQKPQKGEMRLEILESYRESLFTLMGHIDSGTNAIITAIQGGGKTVFEDGLRFLADASVDTPEAEYDRTIATMSDELRTAAHTMREMRVEIMPLVQDAIDGAAGYKEGRARAWGVIKAEYARIVELGKTPILLSSEFSRFIKDLTNQSPHEADRAHAVRGLFDALSKPMNEGGMRLVGELTTDQWAECQQLLIETGNGDFIRRFQHIELEILSADELLESFTKGRVRLGEATTRVKQTGTRSEQVLKDGVLVMKQETVLDANGRPVIKKGKLVTREVPEMRTVPITAEAITAPAIEFGEEGADSTTSETNARSMMDILLKEGINRRTWKQSDGMNYDVDADGKYVPFEGAASAVDKHIRGIIKWKRTKLLSIATATQLTALQAAGYLTAVEVTALRAGGRNPKGLIMKRPGETTDAFTARRMAILNLIGSRITPADHTAYVAAHPTNVPADRLPNYTVEVARDRAARTGTAGAAATSPAPADLMSALVDASALGLQRAKPDKIRAVAEGIADRIERELAKSPRGATMDNTALRALFTRAAQQSGLALTDPKFDEFQRVLVERLTLRGRLPRP